MRYDAIGSGEGTERFLAGSVDVGATDAPRSTAAASRDGGVSQVPVTAGMIAITDNLAGVQGPLNPRPWRGSGIAPVVLSRRSWKPASGRSPVAPTKSPKTSP